MKQCTFLLASAEGPAHAPHNKQLQRTVRDKVPRQRRHHAAAELRR
jgi:hypothetical protein